MGKYYPKEPTNIGRNARFTKFGYTDDNTEKAKERRAELEFKNANIDKHLVKSMARGMIEHVVDRQVKFRNFSNKRGSGASPDPTAGTSMHQTISTNPDDDQYNKQRRKPKKGSKSPRKETNADLPNQ